MQAERGAFLLSTDRSLLDFDAVHGFLRSAYWCPGIPREVVERAAAHSRTFGLYHRPAPGRREQAGYLRVITDHAGFAYLLDVFVLEPFRGQGLARWMVETVMADPELSSVRTWLLNTRDSHALYGKLGFVPLDNPDSYMRRRIPQPWQSPPG
ncbi:GNAT family N-acetyltransferase [Roseomonas sp. BN140053]|uniref:GNAT family N-acetyltransferase n=1 Tax=Roseomonas sp. BN140053 TaxID=3391898 RepID=UPI0039E821B8